jgi:hypothetical protein
MDRLIRLFYGGTMKENLEFENTSEDLELFDSPPCFKDLVGRVTSKFVCHGDEVQLRGHFNCGKTRPLYIMMKLNSESHWNQYKKVVERLNVVCWEVVVDMSRMPSTYENHLPFMVENMTHESALSHDTPVFAPNNPQNEPSFDLAVAADDFEMVFLRMRNVIKMVMRYR